MLYKEVKNKIEMTIRRILKTLMTQTNLMNNNKRMPKLSIMCGVKGMSCDLMVLLTCWNNDLAFFFLFFLMMWHYLN